jgi:flagellar biosynthetic protein FliP
MVVAVCCAATPAHADAMNGIGRAMGEMNGGNHQLSSSLQILVMMGLLTLLPSILLMMTSFTRIVIVLSILRQALGLQQTPPNQVLIGLSLFLSLFVMQPVLSDIKASALDPYGNNQITLQEGIEKSGAALHGFMVRQTRKADIAMFSNIAKAPKYEKAEDIPFSVLLPSFVTSELKTAFQIGFLIFLPFLIIDLVVASALMSLGMMMLSPTIISMPFKLLLFVLVDGWALTMSSLAASFGAG